MATISSSTGINSGFAITDTVDKLMAIAAKPRDLLTAKNTAYTNEETALTSLSALLASVQYVAKNLAKSDLYAQTTATSGNTSALGVAVTGTPAVGTYQFTPVRTAQSQQLLTTGVKSLTDALGGGTLTFRFGDNVQRTTAVTALNGGDGIARGSIRITDRSGASATVDLSAAQTVDDVLQAINGAGIGVTASADGDHLRLTDTTGKTTANLQVQEVGGGTTAASLGLANVNAAVGTTADGTSIYQLYDGIDLAELNDGRGVAVNRTLADIHFALSDNVTSGDIDLSPIISGSSQVKAEATLGDVLKVLNAAAPGKLEFSVGADGRSLVANDLTGGSGSFTLSAINDSNALADLGLNVSASSGVIQGKRLLGGLDAVSLSSLNGGRGLGTLGTLQVTDRAGHNYGVDLSGAQTLQDVVDAINTQTAAHSVKITAQINSSKTGIELVDTSGSTANHMIVADDGTDGTQTATKLQIGVDAAVTSVDSGDLHLQVVGLNTKLSDLNGGAGVAKGTLTITDRAGVKSTLNLASTSIQTVGDVIRAINHLSVNVQARINDTGDGILIQDMNSSGSGTLTVGEGTSTTAKDLHLLGSAASGGTPQVIDGRMTQTITLSSSDSLQSLAEKINDLDAGVTANIFSDGSASPYRLLLTSNKSGAAGELVFAGSGLPFEVQELTQGQDALLALGSGTSKTVYVSSSTNQFKDVLAGTTLTVKQATTSPVTISVDTTDTNVVANVQTFVDNYNKFRSSLTKLTAYDTTTNSAGVLFNDSAALRLDTDLSYLLSGEFYGAGTIHSLADVGVSFNQDGTLTLDTDTLSAKYAEDPQAVEEFFSTKDTGVGAKLDSLLENLAGSSDNSLISSRLKTLQDQVTSNQDHIDALNKLLDSERTRMLNSFYAMDAAVGKMKSLLTMINDIAYIDSSGSSSSSSSSSG